MESHQAFTQPSIPPSSPLVTSSVVKTIPLALRGVFHSEGVCSNRSFIRQSSALHFPTVSSVDLAHSTATVASYERSHNSSWVSSSKTLSKEVLLEESFPASNRRGRPFLPTQPERLAYNRRRKDKSITAHLLFQEGQRSWRSKLPQKLNYIMERREQSSSKAAMAAEKMFQRDENDRCSSSSPLERRRHTLDISEIPLLSDEYFKGSTVASSTTTLTLAKEKDMKFAEINNGFDISLLSMNWVQKKLEMIELDSVRQINRIEARVKKVERYMNKSRSKSLGSRFAALEAQLDEDMKISIIGDRFPPLSPTGIKQVENALNENMNPMEELVASDRLTISRKDALTLKLNMWLNDEVINFYLEMIMHRAAVSTNNSEKVFPTLHSMNTFFLTKLMKSGYQSIRRWTKKVDIFSRDLFIVPCHLGNHWTLCMADFRSKTISYYDSMSCDGSRILIAVRDYLVAEYKEKKNGTFDISHWQLIEPENVPQQDNCNDCGVFLCIHADYLSRDWPLTFTAAKMPYFRKRMVWEILNQSFLI